MRGALEGPAKLATARRVVRMKLPYFATLLDSLAVVWVEGFGTFGVTKYHVVLVDPAVLNAWDLRKVAFVVAHEVLHVFHKHCERAERMKIKPYERTLWNACVDAYINRILAEVFLWHPDDAILPKHLGTPENITAEEAFALLRKKIDQLAQSMLALGDVPENEDATGQTPGTNALVQAIAKLLNTLPQKPHCGSGAGNPFDGEPADPKTGTPAKPGEPGLEHPASRELAQIEILVRQAAENLREAERSKQAGRLPAGLLRTAAELLKPPAIPWQAKLRSNLSRACAWQAGGVDYRFDGISRRQSGVGYGHGKPVLPRLRSPKIRVEWWVDTSGSMSQQELGIAIREGRGALRALAAEMRFMAIDAAVHSDVEVRTVDAMLRALKGGGGTSFVPPFERLKHRKRHERPNVIVYATDGFGACPDFGPEGIKVIWLLIGAGATRPTKVSGGSCDWGSFVEVKS